MKMNYYRSKYQGKCAKILLNTLWKRQEEEWYLSRFRFKIRSKARSRVPWALHTACMFDQTIYWPRRTLYLLDQCWFSLSSCHRLLFGQIQVHCPCPPQLHKHLVIFQIWNRFLLSSREMQAWHLLPQISRYVSRVCDLRDEPWLLLAP